MTKRAAGWVARWTALAIAGALLALGGCTPKERKYGAGGDGGAGGAGGAGGQTSSSTTGTGMGGSPASSSTGVMMQCSTDTACGANSTCQTFSCVGGFCQVAFAPQGTLTPTQTPNDCMRMQCDGAGHEVLAVDATDLPLDDSNPCTQAQCSAEGKPQQAPLGADTPCGDPGWLCDGSGTCYNRCQDKLKNYDETGVDCGGSACGGCIGDDCSVNGCSAGVCCECNMACTTVTICTKICSQLP